jgi:uncharacterized lipoprotein NlpE involved in copper resistance
MIRNLLIIFAVLSFCSCLNQPKTEKPENGKSETFSAPVPDMHNARNALDYFGSYQGVLPCADCEGIEMIIELSPEFLFTRKLRYLGKAEDTVYEKSGEFTWNDAGNTITLQGIDKPNQYFVGENALIHLDMNGERITGELAENYLLHKMIR